MLSRCPRSSPSPFLLAVTMVIGHSTFAVAGHGAASSRISSSSIPRHQRNNHHHNGVQQHYVKASSDTPRFLQTVNGDDEVCREFEAWYGAGFYEQFQASCECGIDDSDGSLMGSWQAECYDQCESCIGDTCAYYSSISYADSASSWNETTASWECNEFVDAFQDEFLCKFQTFPEAVGDDGFCTFTVNDEECESCTPFSSCFIVNCSNLGYGENMDTCSNTGLEGPFAIYGWTDFAAEATLGECVPADPCLALEFSFNTGFFEQFQPSCECSTDISWEAECRNQCQWCIGDTCAYYSSTSFADSASSWDETTSILECNQIVDGLLEEEKLCLFQEFSEDGTSPSCTFTVNDESCESCSICSDETVSGFIVNCSNLGYGENMDTCSNTGLEGPFAIYGWTDFEAEATLGECALAAEPKAASDAGLAGSVLAIFWSTLGVLFSSLLFFVAF